MSDIPLLAGFGAALLLVCEFLALAGMGDLKRMLFWSTLAEAGWVVLGVGLGTAIGETGAWMHLALQVVMRALVVLAAMEIVRANRSSRLSDLVGSVDRAPFASLMFGFGLFSVMGLSPFKGSFSKFVVLYAAIETGHWELAVVGTIASIVAAVYSITTIQRVCFERMSHGILADRPIPFFAIRPGQWPLVALALATIALSLDPEPVLALAGRLAGLGEGGVPQFETAWAPEVLVPYVGGFVLFAFGRFSARLRDAGAVALALATLGLVIAGARSGDLGSLFAVLFAAIGLMVTIYSVRYMAHSHAQNRYWFFLFLMLGSLIGVATVEHLGSFYLFWELMTWTSYLLVVHEQTPAALAAGRKYFLTCAGGAYVMHFGILLLHAHLGTFEVSEIAARAGDLPASVAVVVVATFLVGFIAKAGLFPLHGWLPDAHPAAPSSISGPMSGILTKAGIFGILKLLFVVFGAATLSRMGSAGGLSLPGIALIGLGGATFLLGEIAALRQDDLKRLLAYSTLAQIGEIAMMIGIGTEAALAGGLMHVVVHAAMKTLLFFAAGALIMRAGGRRLSDLAGLGRAMPFTSACFGIGLLAIMGVPPFGGFVAKFLMIWAAVGAGRIDVAAVILAGSVIGAIYYARVLRVVFFGVRRREAVAEAPLSMRLALGVLAAFVVGVGLWPAPLLDQVALIAGALTDQAGSAALPALRLDWSLAAAIALGGSVIVYLAGRGAPRRAGVLAALVVAAALAGVILEADRYDPASFAFALLISGVGVVNLVFSIGYMAHGHAQNRFFALFVAMIGGLLGAVAARDLFGFFAFWEIMSSWTLYLVIIHEESEDALREGTKYFVFNFAGASLLFLGVAILAVGAGTLDFAELPEATAAMDPAWLAAAMGLIFIGLLAKAAQLPLRIDWQMHPAPAPTPVSGYISAVLLKVGPWGILHFAVLLGGAAAMARLAAFLPWWMPAPLTMVGTVAAITMLVAGAQALVQTGIKRLLIWSTVSQLAYVLLGLAIATDIGVAGGLFHFFNHMLLKNTLFLAAGCIMAQGHVTSLDELGGLGRRMPMTFACFLIAGLSLAGIPPLAGFASKWLIYRAAFESGHWAFALAALMSSLFTLAAVLKFAHAAFMGPASPKAERMHEAPAVMLVPMALLVAVSLVVGALPGLALVPIARIEAALGLPAIVATWAGGLPGAGGWNPLVLTILLGMSGAVAALYPLLSGSRKVATRVHACGVGDIAPARMRVPASGLYETPERLIRTALLSAPETDEHSHA
ncbi:proton-conducting transporter membrane subunit [Pleomorphomonas carboxyditropha]|uniref:Oxidoreductase n=1 Tax=Pleomorphomonas carboxyditropha TaxID=2023338 RepID=A0A2G9X0Z0_9HYPH|nr:proton-conducting transporter membrane subunit [Pleomorphomonas carboxyditropha]PIP00253.1 oxidoreductase [Pleomorphomonas carboxyditropha]